MLQQYEKYTDEDHAVWKILFDRQIANLADKGCVTYLNALNKMKEVLNAEHIPNFAQMSPYLFEKTAWRIEVVKGLIPVEEFFQLLSQKKFPSSTWLRKRSQLDYLEEPDMFHDIFGHTPLLIDAGYAEVMYQIGLSCKENNYAPDFVQKMERFYWFTIEFGLVKEKDLRKIYGAGILSSFGESKAIYDPKTIVKDFNIANVLNHDFTKSEMQQEYFVIDSLPDLGKLMSLFSNKSLA